MSGTQHPLFSNAPVMPSAPSLPVVPPGSNLAAVLAQPHPFQLPAPSFGSVPLSSMMQMMKGANDPSTSGVSSSTPNLAWNPNNPVGTETLGGNTANQGSWAGNAAAAYLPGYQAPGTPTAGMPGLPGAGAPGMASGPAPGMPGMGAPGMPSQGQPGALSRGWDLLQQILTGGGSGAVQ